jgi:hypothetical protein
VSRPSVREALIALEVEGWVEVRTGSGVYVLDRSHRAAAPVAPTEWGPLELIRARRVVEGETAAIAAAARKRKDVDAMARAIELMREMADRRDAAARATAPSTWPSSVPAATRARRDGAELLGLAQGPDLHAAGRLLRERAFLALGHRRARGRCAMRWPPATQRPRAPRCTRTWTSRTPIQRELATREAFLIPRQHSCRTTTTETSQETETA